MRIVFVKTIFVVVALCTLIPPAAADQTDAGSGETWLLSTRHAPLCGWLGKDLSRVQCSRLSGEHWVHSDPEQSVTETDPSLPTVVFVHGNRSSSSAAIREGTNLKSRLASFSQRPFNVVIWSWPANRVSRNNRVDVRTKATRSDAQSYYLAIWLRRVKENNAGAPVSLVGYSFGARIITGALHILGGGRLAGRTLPDATQDEQQSEENGADADVEPQQEEWAPFRAVLVAGALDADWLLPGHRNGQALSQVDKILVTKNNADPVLRWYPFISSRRSDAVGYVGPRSCGCPYSGGGKIYTLDVSCPVGRAHAWARYIASRGINAHLAPYTFLDSVEPPAVDSSEE